MSGMGIADGAIGINVFSDTRKSGPKIKIPNDMNVDDQTIEEVNMPCSTSHLNKTNGIISKSYEEQEGDNRRNNITRLQIENVSKEIYIENTVNGNEEIKIGNFSSYSESECEVSVPIEDIDVKSNNQIVNSDIYCEQVNLINLTETEITNESIGVNKIINNTLLTNCVTIEYNDEHNETVSHKMGGINNINIDKTSNPIENNDINKLGSMNNEKFERAAQPNNSTEDIDITLGIIEPSSNTTSSENTKSKLEYFHNQIRLDDESISIVLHSLQGKQYTETGTVKPGSRYINKRRILSRHKSNHRHDIACNRSGVFKDNKSGDCEGCNSDTIYEGCLSRTDDLCKSKIDWEMRKSNVDCEGCTSNMSSVDSGVYFNNSIDQVVKINQPKQQNICSDNEANNTKKSLRVKSRPRDLFIVSNIY